MRSALTRVRMYQKKAQVSKQMGLDVANWEVIPRERTLAT